MPTIVNIIDRVVAWTSEHICSLATLKAPPEDMEAADGEGYEYNEVTPACFPMFVPTADKLPPGTEHNCPCVLVRLTDGEDGRQAGSLDLELWFHTWNPGTHGRDILQPTESGGVREWTGSGSDTHYERNAEGWRDLFNWIDAALRELESTLSIDGLEIDQDRGFRYGPLKDENGVSDYYPFYFGYIGFTLKRPIVRNIKEIDDLL